MRGPTGSVKNCLEIKLLVVLLCMSTCDENGLQSITFKITCEKGIYFVQV